MIVFCTKLLDMFVCRNYYKQKNNNKKTVSSSLKLCVCVCVCVCVCGIGLSLAFWLYIHVSNIEHYIKEMSPSKPQPTQLTPSVHITLFFFWGGGGLYY